MANTTTLYGIVRDDDSGKVMLTDGSGRVLSEVQHGTFEDAPEEAFARLYFDHLNHSGPMKPVDLGTVTL